MLKAMRPFTMKLYLTFLSICGFIGVKLGLQIPIVGPQTTETEIGASSPFKVHTRHLVDMDAPRVNVISTNVTLNQTIQTIYREMSDSDFLQNWNRSCNFSTKANKENTINIDCVVKDNSSLNFVDFRNFTSSLFSLNISFDLYVLCIGGYIRFPWPFRADKLHRVHIKDCIIKDFRREFTMKDIDNIRETVQYLLMENNTIVLTVEEYINSLSKATSSLSRAAECGPENAVAIIRRDTYVQFEDIQNFPQQTNIENEHNKQFNIQKQTCLYKYLEIFEISGTEFLEKNTVNKLLYTDDAQNLKILNFSSCGIYDSLFKHNNWLLRFPGMEYLDLSRNWVQVVPEIEDYGYNSIKSKVRIIDIRYNNISFLTKNMINSFSKLKFVKVDIDENPYLCDCRAIEAMHYLKSMKLPSHYDYLKYLKCVNPVQLRDRLISTLSMDELNCRKENVLNVPVIILGVVITTLFTITTVLIYFRNVIKVVLYTRMNINFPCHDKQDLKHCKEYDAFIAYSEADVGWVMHTLLPKLETGESCKLCFHHRDFTVGAAVTDNIINSIHNSYHTVLIVSNDFLKSDWCMLEFRIALHRSLQDKNRHLIFVIKDNVRFDNLDPDFKNCISTHTYLKIGDLLFWDKLKYAISFRHKNT